MKHNILISITLLAASFVIPLQGQSLSDYLQMAGENNPGLKATYLEYYAALEKVPQVGALPDPQLSFGLFLKPMERYTGNQVADITLMQMFPWFGTTGAARDEARMMAQAKYEAFRERRSKVWYDVKAVWWRMWSVEQELLLLDEQMEILKTLEEVAIQRIRSGGGVVSPSGDGAPSMSGNMKDPQTAGGMSGMGEMGSNAATAAPSQNMAKSGGMSDMGRQSGSLADVLRLQMEINDLQVRQETLVDELTALKASFNGLLNRAADSTLEVSDTIPNETENDVLTIDAINSQNPMLQMYRNEEQAYEAMERMNKKMGMPMMGLGLQYGIFEPRPGNESMMNGENMLMPMVSVSIPIWRRKYNASVREAALMRESAVAEQLDIINQITSDFHFALYAMRDSERRINHNERQAELAQRVLNLLISRYSVSGADFDELMRLQSQLVDYRILKAQAKADKQMAVARLELLAGN